MSIILLLFAAFIPQVSMAECEFDSAHLLMYERKILKAAETNNVRDMAEPLACILQLQAEGEGFDRYLSSSFLRPILGGEQTPGTLKDRRYKVVAAAIEQLAIKESDSAQDSFLEQFSRGDWRYYTLFCEQGSVDFCVDFMPTSEAIRSAPPVLAAASMLRLKKAYGAVSGAQRELIGRRLKQLYAEIPTKNRLQRKMIERIYHELFGVPTPLGYYG